MARKIRFPLIMKNGTDVRTLEELRENFDLKAVLSYFENGKLKTWLEDRYYDKEAEAISVLDKNDADLSNKICSILGVAFTDDEVDMTEIERRNEKLKLIRQYSDDKEIINNIDSVAFNQDDLLDILDNGITKIYLCHGKFEIPSRISDVTYIGIKEPEVSLMRGDRSDYDSKNIKFIDIPSLGKSDKELIELGEKYLKGDGVENNPEKAVELFTQAASHGNAEAQLKLSDCYRLGTGVSVDYKKVYEYALKSAEQGHAISQNYLGVCYEVGGGIEKNYDKAVEWYIKSAEQGCAHAQCNLGYCYEKGNGVQQNYEKAVEWYRKAAEQGYARAQRNLGCCYGLGQGVQQSYIKAVEWYRKAAEQGYAVAQYNLGYYYDEGKGVQKSYKKAAEWYCKAAEQGYDWAQCNLGYCYEKGKGVHQNYEKAIEWYRKAAKQGNTTAQNNLKILGKSW